MSDSRDVTVLLKEMSDGDKNAPEQILPLVYDELRKLAHAYLKNERQDHTLQATALVHEAYIRLIDWKTVSWQNRAHFFSVAANVMRNILVDHARAKNSSKRDGQKIALDDAISLSREKDLDLLRLEESLKILEEMDERQAKIVELRFFGGLSIEETAYILDISPSTVKREWIMAKAWFQRELTRS